MPADISPKMLAPAIVLALCSACSESGQDVPEQVSITDAQLPATVTIKGNPADADVVTLSWFPGNSDDDPEGDIHEYEPGMALDPGMLLLLIEREGYESLMARRLPIVGRTTILYDLCETDSGCYGSVSVRYGDDEPRACDSGGASAISCARLAR